MSFADMVVTAGLWIVAVAVALVVLYFAAVSGLLAVSWAFSRGNRTFSAVMLAGSLALAWLAWR